MNGKAIIGQNCYAVVEPENDELKILEEESVLESNELLPINEEVHRGTMGAPNSDRVQGQPQPYGSSNNQSLKQSYFMYIKKSLFG